MDDGVTWTAFGSSLEDGVELDSFCSIDDGLDENVDFLFFFSWSLFHFLVKCSTCAERAPLLILVPQQVLHALICGDASAL